MQAIDRLSEEVEELEETLKESIRDALLQKVGGSFGVRGSFAPLQEVQGSSTRPH